MSSYPTEPTAAPPLKQTRTSFEKKDLFGEGGLFGRPKSNQEQPKPEDASSSDKQ